MAPSKVILLGTIAISLHCFASIHHPTFVASLPQNSEDTLIPATQGAYANIPTTDSPEVREWVKLVDWSKVPNIPVRSSSAPGSPPPCPEEDPSEKENDEECWWTCTGCHSDDDITECPRPKDWGLTYDDGPEPGVTEVLMDELQARNVTATFFVTGIKSTQGAWLLKEAIKRGHHLASHTWSHFGMTTLTNEEVVAELKWTEKYIYDNTGYRVKYFRPPYGDIDNRVREIARQLGFRTVIWTPKWDTNDWQLEHQRITNSQVESMFRSALDSVPDRETGVITLEHDGRRTAVDMAGPLLDMGIRQGMRPMDIPKCLGDPVGYNEVPASARPPPPPPPPESSSPSPSTESSTASMTSTITMGPTLLMPSVDSTASLDASMGKVTPLPESEARDKEGSTSPSSSGAPALRLLKATKDCATAFGWTVSVSLLLSFLVV